MSKAPLRPATVYQEDLSHGILPLRIEDDGIYAAAIASFVIVCTDAMIIDRARHTAWLASRKILPMKGFWIIGGRRLPGESIQTSIRRCFARETSLKITSDRFEYIRQNEYLWSKRQQVPQNVGSHNIADTFAIELTPDERDAASRSLTSSEYEAVGLQEFDRQAMLDAKVHPALIDLYDSVF